MAPTKPDAFPAPAVHHLPRPSRLPSGHPGDLSLVRIHVRERLPTANNRIAPFPLSTATPPLRQLRPIPSPSPAVPSFHESEERRRHRLSRRAALRSVLEEGNLIMAEEEEDATDDDDDADNSNSKKAQQTKNGYRRTE
jgi:hypothetical protein